MKYIIIEDELYAYKELHRMLQKLYPKSTIVAHYDSVEAAIDGLGVMDPKAVDLIFFDISLPDGYSFDILNRIKIKTPIIFTTAYDAYALKAFKYNSIDYLLKPIDIEDLKVAIDKFETLKSQYTQLDITQLSKLFKPSKSQKKRFLVKIGDKYTYINIENIAYFYSEDGLSFIKTFDEHSYSIDQSLSEIEVLLSDDFFRVSRNMICALQSIESSSKYFNSRLKLKLNPSFKEDVLISRVKVNAFLEWMDG